MLGGVGGDDYPKAWNFKSGTKHTNTFYKPPSSTGDPPCTFTIDGKYKFLHCEDSVTVAEVDPWLGCHGYLLPIASLTNCVTNFALWHLS